MSKALATIASPDSLAEAWREMFTRSRRFRRDSFGIDGESINLFREDERRNIATISKQIRKGEYRFSPLTAHIIQKSSGPGSRVICVPTVRDRLVQRSILNYVSGAYMGDHSNRKSRLLKNRVSYGFIKGRNVEDAIEAACDLRSRRPWVYKTDISSFFDKIPRDELAETIRKHVAEKSLHPLLIAASECEVDESRFNVRRELRLLDIRRGRGVRQGMPLSPLFANLLMIGFDRVLTRKGVTALRYADDLIFFGESEEQCLSLHEFCKQELARLDLTVPELAEDSKSQICRPDSTVDFLGVGIALKDGAYRPIVTSRQFTKMRDKFLTLADVTQLVTRRISLSTFGTVLDSTAEGYLGCYQFCHNFPEVEHFVEDLREVAVKRLFKDAFHCDVNILPAATRAFVGV